MGARYCEAFDDGPGGWYGWIDNQHGYKRLMMRDSAIITHSPWWIDYNHAPPGAGYLHMLACLQTAGASGEYQKECAVPNRFVIVGFTTDMRGAKLTLRLRGELETRGANLLLLVQGAADRKVSGWALTGRPFHVTKDWSEQTVLLEPDEKLWTGLGARHDRTDSYGRIDLARILADVNVNIMLIMFPLNVAPMLPMKDDPHKLRAGKDYPVWASRLPEGYVMVDEVRIDFPR